jgi:hypothetical protein
MRNTIKITMVLSALLCATMDLQAQQNECTDYHKFECPPARDKRFSLNGQSKSAPVQVGRQTELNIIVYKGQDYRISFCHDAAVLGNELAIRLVEKVRQPVDEGELTEVVKEEPIRDEDGNPTGFTREVRTSQGGRRFKDVEKVLWDNSEHEMAQEVEFSCTSTKRLCIQINATGPDEGARSRRAQQFDIACVGIRVEHMTTPPLGFEPQRR